MPTGSRSGPWQQRGTLASTTPTGGSLQQDSAASLLLHIGQSSWKEKKGVQFPKFWSDSVVFGAVLFTKFYFTITSCSERNISMFEKLLQLFVISLGMGQL